jgi:hypothetical protein
VFEVSGRDVASLILTVLLVAVLVVAARRGRLVAALVVMLMALAASWSVAAIAVRADYRDADGFVDCWPYCSTFQDAIGGTLFYGPVAALVLLVAAGVLLVRRRVRSARSS